jgi:hypothetical protein
MPAHNLGMRWTPGELQSAATQGMSMISPIGNPAGSYGYLRSNDGFGIYATLPEQGQTCLVAFAFCSGEVWTIDTITLRVRSVSELPILFLNESDFGVSLKRYSEFLSKLGVPPPYRWVAGMEGLKGRAMYLPAPPGRAPSGVPQGHGVGDAVVTTGFYRMEEDPEISMAPFFEEIYQNCCLERPNWLKR